MEIDSFPSHKIEEIKNTYVGDLELTTKTIKRFITSR
ncbi:hypothetical protein Gogos_001620 [Gossypium gossypioides]|uniref:Uncharacterized protein n=1 Tax=Gossypium gossypioides TaxID=34282 RepID=A0A7J9CWT5_GOSGO|nr:hypothetical protein [Gossypium gossypioides]